LRFGRGLFDGLPSEDARYVEDEVGDIVNFFAALLARGDSGAERFDRSRFCSGSDSTSLAVPGISPVKNPTTAPPTPRLLLSSVGFPLLSPSGNPSCSGVKIRVSLYPASLNRSSSRSYVLDVPRRWRGTWAESPRPKLDGYLRRRRGGVDGGDAIGEAELLAMGESVSLRRGCRVGEF
jgi:hypothetical protein